MSERKRLLTGLFVVLVLGGIAGRISDIFDFTDRADFMVASGFGIVIGAILVPWIMTGEWLWKMRRRDGK